MVLIHMLTSYNALVNCSVSCAGIMPARKTISQSRSFPNTIRTHSLLEFSTTMDVNATGTFNISRLAAQRMATRDPDDNGLRGVLVNTASIVAYEGQVGQVAYSASKGAVVGMTLPMARGEFVNLNLTVWDKNRF